MRVLLGLAALAASVSAQTTVTTVAGTQFGSFATPIALGTAPLSSIEVHETTQTGISLQQSPAIGTGFVNSLNWVLTASVSTVNTIYFKFGTNTYTGQMQYRWSPNYPSPATAYPGNNFQSTTYTCDQCTAATGQPGTPVTCNSAVGPGGSVTVPALSTLPTGFQCALLTRWYKMDNLATGNSVTRQNGISSFSMQVFDINQNPAPNVSSYSFIIQRPFNPIIVGDPQIVGMQGQDFQVHGIPDEIFNMITYPTLQVNARFTYLESAECHDNYTACFAHPGTYITEEGIRVGKDKVRIHAGKHAKGLTVSVNGKKVTMNADLKQGAVEVVNHRRVIVHTNIMKITVTNSDKFLNQELELNDDKLITLGSKRRTLKDNERFHAEVPLHGLQGQTWRNVEYPSGLDYEGSITDYHVTDGNLFGTDFVFNHFEA